MIWKKGRKPERKENETLDLMTEKVPFEQPSYKNMK